MLDGAASMHRVSEVVHARGDGKRCISGSAGGAADVVGDAKLARAPSRLRGRGAPRGRARAAAEAPRGGAARDVSRASFGRQGRRSCWGKCSKSWTGSCGCHELASGAISGGFCGKARGFWASDVDGAGACHEPPSRSGGWGKRLSIAPSTWTVSRTGWLVAGAAWWARVRDRRRPSRAPRRADRARRAPRRRLRLADADRARGDARVAHARTASSRRCARSSGGDALEIFDGFKRLRAARGLGLRELRAVVIDVDVVEATVHMRELHAGRGLTALEEAWIVRSLYRDHHLSQGAIAARLRCHKSWVCRRLMLVEALDRAVQADVRLGLLAPRAAVLVAALPRGNQSVASGVVIRRGLTVRQTASLVRELADAADAAAEQAVLARWTRRGVARRRGRPRRARRAASPRRSPSTSRRFEGARGDSRHAWPATPLAALAPAAADVVRREPRRAGWRASGALRTRSPARSPRPPRRRTAA